MAASSSSERIGNIVLAAVAELALPYRVMDIFAVRNQAYSWCVKVIDPQASRGRRVFEVNVDEGEFSDENSLKEIVKRQLRWRRR